MPDQAAPGSVSSRSPAGRERIDARNVILGAGAMGSAAAYHLAKRGEPVLLIDQFALGHDRGSSHGAGRITRHSYADPVYARWMPEAFRAWRTLEADAGQPVFVRTGGVTFGPPGSTYVDQVAGNLEAIEVPHRRMRGSELRQALPVFDLPDAFEVVFEPDAGMLAAARAVALQVELARRFGGDRTRVLERTAIRRIDLEASRPVLLGDTLEVVAERLIVTAGPWTPRLVPGLAARLIATRQHVLYLRPADPGPFEIGRFPVFIYKGDEDLDAFYGMPPFLGCGVKVARHGGPAVDPDAVDRSFSDEDRAVVRRFLSRVLPSLADAPIDREEICLYTVAPDEHFCFHAPGGRPDVIVASPCSGHGFKFSCLIGRILADRIQDSRADFPEAAWWAGA